METNSGWTYVGRGELPRGLEGVELAAGKPARSRFRRVLLLLDLRVGGGSLMWDPAWC